MATQPFPNEQNKKPKQRATWYFFYLPFLIIIGLAMLNMGVFYVFEINKETKKSNEIVVKDNLRKGDEIVSEGRIVVPTRPIIVERKVEVTDYPPTYAKVKRKCSVYNGELQFMESEESVPEDMRVLYARKAGNFYYCQYKDENGQIHKKWIRENDLNFNSEKQDSDTSNSELNAADNFQN